MSSYLEQVRELISTTGFARVPSEPSFLKKTAAECAAELRQFYDSLSQPIIPMPWESLQRILGDKTPARGHLIELLAERKSGKTTTAVNLVDAWTKRRLRVFLDCVEMERLDLTDKLLAKIAADATSESAPEFGDRLSLMNWGDGGIRSVDTIDALIDRWKNVRLWGRIPDVFIYDNLQAITNTLANGDDNRAVEMGRIAAAFKDFAMRNNILVVFLSQENRPTAEQMKQDLVRGEAAREGSSQPSNWVDASISLVRGQQNHSQRRAAVVQRGLQHARAVALGLPTTSGIKTDEITAVVTLNRRGADGETTLYFDGKNALVRDFTLAELDERIAKYEQTSRKTDSKPMRHSHTNVPEYLRRWWKNNKNGDRVPFHEPWKNDPQAAYAYVLETIGERPSERHSIDRYDNDSGYEPGNIWRWATKKQQSTHRGRWKENRFYLGTTLPPPDAAYLLDLADGSIYDPDYDDPDHNPDVDI